VYRVISIYSQNNQCLTKALFRATTQHLEKSADYIILVHVLKSQKLQLNLKTDKKRCEDTNIFKMLYAKVS